MRDAADGDAGAADASAPDAAVQDAGPPVRTVTQVDLLFVVDNSEGADVMQAVGSPNGTDPINGHESAAADAEHAAGAPNTLQFAAVFPRVLAAGPAAVTRVPLDCSSTQRGCWCEYPVNDLPICNEDPAFGRTTQDDVPVFPGLRHLSVARALGARGIVGSAVPPQVDDAAAADFGYLPNVNALTERVRPLLAR